MSKIVPVADLLCVYPLSISDIGGIDIQFHNSATLVVSDIRKQVTNSCNLSLLKVSKSSFLTW